MEDHNEDTCEKGEVTMQKQEMPCLNDTPCRIEDRRAQSSLYKPSSVFELLCEDCGNHFLIVVAVADATDYTSVCRECWNARALLTVWGKDKEAVEARLDPSEDVLDFLTRKFPRRNRAWVEHRDGSRQVYFADSEGWKELVTCNDCCADEKGCSLCLKFQNTCGNEWVCTSFKLPEGCDKVLPHWLPCLPITGFCFRSLKGEPVE